MKRRHFITTASLAAPLVATGMISCKPASKEKTGNEPQNGVITDPLVEKAITAMLCMQRMGWEQGTASQALMAAGHKEMAILFAHDAVVRQTKDGRLGIVGSDPGVTDPASNGEAVMFAWRETGDVK